MKLVSAYFITPPINTELTEPDVPNQVSGAKIKAHVVLEPEVSFFCSVYIPMMGFLKMP